MIQSGKNQNREERNHTPRKKKLETIVATVVKHQQQQKSSYTRETYYTPHPVLKIKKKKSQEKNLNYKIPIDSNQQLCSK